MIRHISGHVQVHSWSLKHNEREIYMFFSSSVCELWTWRRPEMVRNMQFYIINRIMLLWFDRYWLNFSTICVKLYLVPTPVFLPAVATGYVSYCLYCFWLRGVNVTMKKEEGWVSKTELQYCDGGRHSNSKSLWNLMISLCANCREGSLDIHRHAYLTYHIRTNCFCRAKEPLNLRRVPTALTLGRCPVCVWIHAHILVWTWWNWYTASYLDTSGSRSETPGKFWNLVLKKDGDQLDWTREKWRSIT
jgi:hypothetical protein